MRDVDMGYDQVPCIDDAGLHEPMLTAADCARSSWATTCHAAQLAAMDVRLHEEHQAMRELYLECQADYEAKYPSMYRRWPVIYLVRKEEDHECAA